MAEVNGAVCSQCGAPVTPGASFCTYCGEQFAAQAPVQQPQPQRPAYQQPPVQQPVYQQPIYQQQQPIGVDPGWPLRSKIAAGILAILLGGIGAHKFYLGKGGMGILCILFCWTGIPELVGFIEGIIYLTTSDINFQQKHHVRLQ